MKNAHYIIFHPDKQRQKVAVKANALVNNLFQSKWNGVICVDRIHKGNEDPFVFNDPWVYSYCHASQLRRKERKDCFLQEGSKIIFVSGQQADKGILSVDTVFHIGGVNKWTPKPNLQLPEIFKKHFHINSSPLWRRHFRFPFSAKKSHDSVTHSYSAKLWKQGEKDFSFLPLNKNGENISVPFEKLSQHLHRKIKRKVKGKYPVLLSDKEIQLVVEAIEGETVTKVLRNINEVMFTGSSEFAKC